MKFAVEAAFGSSEPTREVWDRFVLETNAPIYMSYDWLRLWWQFYGAGHKLRVFTFSERDSLVGILPFYLSQVGFPPFRIRVARLVGANIPARIFNPPVHGAFAAEIWRTTLRQLIAREGCDILSIGPLSETYTGLEALNEAARNSDSEWANASLRQRDVHTVYYLPKTFDEFLASIDGKERKIRRKKLRDLEAKGHIRVEVVKNPAAVEEEFEAFRRQHTFQWEAEGRPGHFHAWPRALEYHRALIKAHGQLGRARIVRMLVGDEVVAHQYNYAFGRTLFAELPARMAGPEWDRLSLGCSSQVKLIEAAIREGFEKMESGMGHYDYKVLLGGREHRALTLRAHACGASARTRIRSCSMMRDLLMVVAHKIWYRRISPRLPKRFRSGQPKTVLAYDY